jgi:hypothetical protein
MKFLIAVTLAISIACGASIATAQDIPSPPLAPQGATPEALSDALVLHSRHTARIENGALTGEGADFLRTLGQSAQFVILGEQHGNSGIAQFAQAYWRDLNALGYNYAVSESDPWVTRALERELRVGGPEAWRSFLGSRGGATGAPFYSWQSEVDWINEVVTRSRVRGGPTIWGVDQVFIGAAPWLMRDLAASASDAEARSLAAQLLVNSEGNLNWLAQVDAAALQQLRQSLNRRRDADYAALIDAMIASQRIYRPFTGGGGETYIANNERENLMRRLFQEHYEMAASVDRRPPRVVIKLGASHAYRGASTTQVQGFGGFVSEFAAARGTQAVTILMLCPREGQVAQFIGPAASCSEDIYARQWAFIEPYLEPGGITCFDLRTWRLRPSRWRTLPTEVQRAILSFDVLVFVAPSPPAVLLEGFTPPSQPAG